MVHSVLYDGEESCHSIHVRRTNIIIVHVSLPRLLPLKKRYFSLETLRRVLSDVKMNTYFVFGGVVT